MNGFLKNAVRLYSLIGGWPPAREPSFFEKLKQNISLFLVITSTIYNALQYLDIYVEWGNLGYFAKNATITFLYTIYLFKAWVFYTRREEIISISREIDSYEDKILVEDNNDNRRKIDLLRRCQRRFENYRTGFWTVTFLTVCFMFSYPALTIVYTGDWSLRPMIARLHFPFSLNPLGNYVAAYTIELVFGILSVLHIIAYDAYFVACILFAIARLQILRYSVETMNERARFKLTRQNPKPGSSLNDYSDRSTRDEFHKIVAEELKICVEEHRRIITFCKKIDSMISLVLFATFFAYSAIICFIGFYGLLVGVSFDLLILGQYLAALITETYFYHWYGNELMLESLKVADSAMESDWQDFDKKNVKTISLLIFRSQNPIFLTAGKFFTVTLSTLLSLLRSSYSYFALLKQFYD